MFFYSQKFFYDKFNARDDKCYAHNDKLNARDDKLSAHGDKKMLAATNFMQDTVSRTLNPSSLPDRVFFIIKRNRDNNINIR